MEGPEGADGVSERAGLPIETGEVFLSAAIDQIINCKIITCSCMVNGIMEAFTLTLLPQQQQCFKKFEQFDPEKTNVLDRKQFESALREF